MSTQNVIYLKKYNNKSRNWIFEGTREEWGSGGEGAATPPLKRSVRSFDQYIRSKEPFRVKKNRRFECSRESASFRNCLHGFEEPSEERGDGDSSYELTRRVSEKGLKPKVAEDQGLERRTWDIYQCSCGPCLFLCSSTPKLTRGFQYFIVLVHKNTHYTAHGPWASPSKHRLCFQTMGLGLD